MHSDNQSPKENLRGEEAILKLKELAEKSRNCFFSTRVQRFPHTTRPMALQEVDDKGNLWFVSSTESNKNKEIAEDKRVELFFHNSSSYEFLAISGEASIHTDKATIEKYWTNFANAWFDGKNDPTVSIIKVAPIDSDYWDTKDGKIVSFLKMSFMAITGQKGDDGGVEGKLDIN